MIETQVNSSFMILTFTVTVLVFAWLIYKTVSRILEIVPHWETYTDDDGEMIYVRWSQSNEDGEYLWVEHYPNLLWGRSAAHRRADELNRTGRMPQEYVR
jgi:hypothetical protein